ncbi:hypothetical protein RRG08_017158 [Elysia crispata]|uniref:Uncharacterized protein n=1 Tax=Elysia crispata TaxID=231223 RepID=A0AAE1B293_9GAST|nr:hypothetical protein RRG08_017158 [Elysia crispata]
MDSGFTRSLAGQLVELSHDSERIPGATIESWGQNAHLNCSTCGQEETCSLRIQESLSVLGDVKLVK